MARRKLGIKAAAPAREPELIRAEMKHLELILQKCRGKPGFAARVAEAEQRLVACQAELDKG